jgi:hypothetical protein
MACADYIQEAAVSRAAAAGPLSAGVVHMCMATPHPLLTGVHRAAQTPTALGGHCGQPQQESYSHSSPLHSPTPLPGPSPTWPPRGSPSSSGAVAVYSSACAPLSALCPLIHCAQSVTTLFSLEWSALRKMSVGRGEGGGGIAFGCSKKQNTSGGHWQGWQRGPVLHGSYAMLTCRHRVPQLRVAYGR